MTKLSGWMPSPTLDLLLHAALDDPPAAHEAWLSWSKEVNLVNDELENDSFQLLPLVYDNLKEILSNKDATALKGITRYQWTRTQISLAKGAQALQMLHEHGVPTLVLKGAALIAAGIVRPIQRSMFDLDVLVPPNRATDAIDLLRQSHWTPVYDTPESRFSLMHSLDLTLDKVSGLDLHWYAIAENCHPGIDDNWWNSAVQTTIHGVQTRRLNTSLLLFHVLAHGARWNPNPSRRWVADAVLILRASETIAWDHVIASAQERAMTWQTGAMLRYLHDHYLPTIPEQVIEQLSGSSVSFGEKLEYRLRNRQKKGLNGVLFHLHNYWRLTRGTQTQRLSPVGYLKRWWGVADSRALALTIVRRTRKRLVAKDSH